jgi:ferredoxin
MADRVLVDAGRCVRSGLCATIAPDVFDLGAVHAVQVVPRVPPERRADVDEAVTLCPAEALRWAGDD